MMGLRSCSGASRWIGIRLPSCLALLLVLTASSCGPKVLTEIKPETVLPPELSCDAFPAVPTIDQLAAANGDQAVAMFIARSHAAWQDCADAVDAMNKWRADHVPHP